MVMQQDGLWQAIKLFGSQKALAKKLGISEKRLNNWVCEKHYMPAHIARRIVEMTGGVVSYDLLKQYLSAEEKQDEVKVFISHLSISEQVVIGCRIEHDLVKKRGRSEKEYVHNYAHLYHGKRSRDIAAEKSGFGSHFTYDQAKKVMKTGIPDLITAMDAGVISISTAAVIASLSPEEQSQIISKSEKEIIAIAKDIQARRREQKQLTQQ